jgi:glutamate/tyrosine decarboxylase-like PLP-dependent enzyme
MARLPVTELPDEGRSAADILDDLVAAKAGDRDWRSGRVFSLVYSAGEEIHELHAQALGLYSAENGLNVLAFPSIGFLSHDLVSWTSALLGGEETGATGFLTSGGTESLLQAVKVARDAGRARGIERPKVVAARSAHAAFTKAAELFDVDLVRVGVDQSFRIDLAEAEAAIDDATIMLVGSAPSYPHGVIDDIAALGAMASDRGLLLHVDACLGGLLLPWLVEAGHVTKPYDLRVPGVTSISADLHKYGYASKGVSVVLYNDAELARHQIFMTTDWMGGFYASTAMAGTRPAGPVAAAWATMQRLGRSGYAELAERTWTAARDLIDGVAAIDGLMILGDPDMTVLAIAADRDDLDVFTVADHLSATGGWYLDRQSDPDALHLTIHAGSAPAVGPFLLDLAEAVTAVGTTRSENRSAPYASDR